MALVGGIASLGGGAYRRQRKATTTELSADLAQLLALQDSLSKPLPCHQRDLLRAQAEVIFNRALQSAARSQITSAQLMAVHLVYTRLLPQQRRSRRVGR